MELVPTEIPKKISRSSKYINTINDFVASGMEAAKVELDGQKAQSAWVSLHKAAKEQGQVKVMKRGEEIYLQRLS